MRGIVVGLRGSLAFLSVASVLLLSVPAQAAGKSREQREIEARKNCAAGRVEAGIEILAELLAEYGHPNYIYNQGRCYQQNGRSLEAITRFKEYLRAAQDAPPDERSRVERFIAELEQELQKASPPPPPAEPPRAQVEQIGPTVAQPPPVAASTPAGEMPRASHGHGLRTAGIVLGAAAVAGLATGIVSSLQVRSLQQDVESAKLGKLSGAQVHDREQKAHRFEALQWVGYGVAGAAAAGSLVCLIMDASHTSTERASAVRLLGSIGTDGRPRLVLAGQF
jgi:hypothetical protein